MHFGQYQGAGVLTGFGLLRWHMAQRKRLPFTADFGRIFLPVLRIFSAINASGRILFRTATRFRLNHRAVPLPDAALPACCASWYTVKMKPRVFLDVDPRTLRCRAPGVQELIS